MTKTMPFYIEAWRLGEKMGGVRTSNSITSDTDDYLFFDFEYKAKEFVKSIDREHFDGYDFVVCQCGRHGMYIDN